MLRTTSALFVSFSLLASSACASTHGRFDAADAGPIDAEVTDAPIDAVVANACQPGTFGAQLVSGAVAIGTHTGVVTGRTDTTIQLLVDDSQPVTIVYPRDAEHDAAPVGTRFSVERTTDGFTTFRFDDRWTFIALDESGFSEPSSNSYAIPGSRIAVARTEACTFPTTCNGRSSHGARLAATATIDGVDVELQSGESASVGTECSRGELRMFDGTQAPGCSETHSDGHTTIVEGYYHFSFLYTCAMDEVFAGTGEGSSRP